MNESEIDACDALRMTGINISEDSTHTSDINKIFAQRYAAKRSKSIQRSHSYIDCRIIVGSITEVERLCSIFNSMSGLN